MQIVAQVRAGSGRFLEILVSSALKIFGAALEDVPNPAYAKARVAEIQESGFVAPAQLSQKTRAQLIGLLLTLTISYILGATAVHVFFAVQVWTWMTWITHDHTGSGVNFYPRHHRLRHCRSTA